MKQYSFNVCHILTVAMPGMSSDSSHPPPPPPLSPLLPLYYDRLVKVHSTPALHMVRSTLRPLRGWGPGEGVGGGGGRGAAMKPERCQLAQFSFEVIKTRVYILWLRHWVYLNSSLREN